MDHDNVDALQCKGDNQNFKVIKCFVHLHTEIIYQQQIITQTVGNHDNKVFVHYIVEVKHLL